MAGDVLVGLDADEPLLLEVALDGAALRRERDLVEEDLLDLGVGLLALGPSGADSGAKGLRGRQIVQKCQ